MKRNGIMSMSSTDIPNIEIAQMHGLTTTNGVNERLDMMDGIQYTSTKIDNLGESFAKRASMKCVNDTEYIVDLGTECTPKLLSLLQNGCEPETQVQVIRTVIASQYIPVMKDRHPCPGAHTEHTDCHKQQLDHEIQTVYTKEEEPPNSNEIKRTSTLQFPPCLVCGGKASGMHYGVNTCEACKGFFRRFLIRNQEYKCMKDGKCEVVNRNRGNCSGCRLQRCLELGMAKENSKLGRYTLARRTQTIQSVNKLEGKQLASKLSSSNLKSSKMAIYPVQFQAKKFVCQPEKIPLKIKIEPIEEIDSEFSGQLVDILLQSMCEVKPYGPFICTENDVRNALTFHIERYKKKVEAFGAAKTIPKNEYYKLYQEFGIDIDNRMGLLKETAACIETTIDNYCNFAKTIPNFSRLSFRDQCNLLKSSRCDFFIILMHEGYSSNVFLTHNGVGYHLEEVADKFFSRQLILTVCDMYERWQKLSLTREEKAVLIALTIVFTDRCSLDDHSLVEHIQLSLVRLLRRQLELTNKATARRRFLKIIDYLTLMRETSELYLKEYKLLCKDDIVVEECPMITEFLFEDW